MSLVLEHYLPEAGVTMHEYLWSKFDAIYAELCVVGRELRKVEDKNGAAALLAGRIATAGIAVMALQEEVFDNMELRADAEGQ